MRNRRAVPNAFPDPAPAAPPASEPPERTRYDDLVDVLADGLFEVLMTEPPPAEMRASDASGPEPRPGAGSPSTYSE